MTRRAHSDLAAEVVERGYDGLFMYLDRSSLNELWQRPGAPSQFDELVRDQSAGAPARFLAAEVLWERRPSSPPSAADLGRVYATALLERTTRVANPWGLPGAGDGVVARHVLELHDALRTARELRFLLEDRGGDEEPLMYIGSEDATEGNRYRYRVRDIAAELVAALLEIPYAVVEDPAERDRRIEQVRVAADTALSKGAR
jgi:hypothetical protein